MEMIMLQVYRGLKTEPYPKQPIIISKYRQLPGYIQATEVPESMSFKDYALWFMHQHCRHTNLRYVEKYLMLALGISIRDINRNNIHISHNFCHNPPEMAKLRKEIITCITPIYTELLEEEYGIDSDKYKHAELKLK